MIEAPAGIHFTHSAPSGNRRANYGQKVIQAAAVVFSRGMRGSTPHIDQHMDRAFLRGDGVDPAFDLNFTFRSTFAKVTLPGVAGQLGAADFINIAEMDPRALGMKRAHNRRTDAVRPPVTRTTLPLRSSNIAMEV